MRLLHVTSGENQEDLRFFNDDDGEKSIFIE